MAAHGEQVGAIVLGEGAVPAGGGLGFVGEVAAAESPRVGGEDLNLLGLGNGNGDAAIGEPGVGGLGEGDGSFLASLGERIHFLQLQLGLGHREELGVDKPGCRPPARWKTVCCASAKFGLLGGVVDFKLSIRCK